ncbi:MAG: aldehyde reductase [Cyclobacteriaceae bacterium]|nr:aldehyde reductase [Cyclobacteriaceae bacterium]
MRAINKEKPVLVTGASGYIASWIVLQLLEKGITVHGTVRNFADVEKIQHLQVLQQNYPGKLKLFEADLLKDRSFDQAMQGCELIIHTASPFLIGKIDNPQQQLIQPAVEGTRNVLESVNRISSVKRVVLTSSVVSIYGDAIDLERNNKDKFNEQDWNVTSTPSHQPYNYSKVMAEKEAWKIVKKQQRWDLLVINPGFVLGPSLSNRTDSTSMEFMHQMVSGKMKSGVPDLYFGVVDVRDVANAHLLAGFTPSASGRHILVAKTLNVSDMARIVSQNSHDKVKVSTKKLPKILMYLFGPLMGFSWKYVNNNIGKPLYFDNSYSIEDLGVLYRDVETTLNEHVQTLIS